jgi:GDP-4-dehydro-6-deoxy-D-mannose reductase
MKKVLIFGACGFVGHYLVESFSSEGYEVFASDTSEDSKGLKCSYCKADITNFDQVNGLIGRVSPDYIVNLAAISSVALSWKIPQQTFSVNVLGILNVLESLIANKLTSTKVLVVGSSEEYLPKNEPLSVSDPLDSNNPYGISKTTQEQLAHMYSQKYGLPIIMVRSFNHTGIGQNDSFVIPSFCKQVAEIEKRHQPGKILVGNLEAVRDFSDVRDVVGCYRWLLENRNSGIFNVGSGEAHSLKDILNFIISLSTQKIDIVIDPLKFRPIDTPYICCKKGETPYKFSFSIQETIRDLYAFYLKH